MLKVLEVVLRQLTLLGFAIVFFVAAGSLALPLGPDQAVFAWVGGVILDGGVPYKDAWDIKGPLTHYVYALAGLLFGRNELSIRVLDIAFVVSCCWLLRKVVLSVSKGETLGANYAVILFCLMYYAGGYADLAQPDGWGGMVILGVVALLLTPTTRPYIVMTIAGVLVAIAVLFKPTFLIYMLLPCIFGANSRSENPGRLWPSVLCLFSFGLVIGAAGLLLERAGALDDFLDVQRYLYTTYQHYKRPPWTLVRVIYEFGLLFPYLLVPLGWWRIRAECSSRSALLVALWFVLANLVVIAQGRYWQDHMLPAATAAAVLAAVALAYSSRRLLVREDQHLGLRALGLSILLAAVAPLAARALSRNYHWPAYIAGLEAKVEYIDHVMKPYNEVRTPFNYMELCELADFIEHHSQPDDKFVVWGWDVSLFDMSRRHSATRFGTFIPLITNGAVQGKFRNTFLREVSAHSPSYVIIDTRGGWFYADTSGLMLPDNVPKDTAGLRYLDEFPEFKQLVHSQYRLTSVVGVYQIWGRAPSE